MEKDKLENRQLKAESELFRLENEIKNIKNVLIQKEQNYLILTGKLIEINEQIKETGDKKEEVEQ